MSSQGRSIRIRRARRKIHAGGFDLQLTSMIDIMVVILVFLLKSYSTSINTWSMTPGMQLPLSSSGIIPQDALQILVTPSEIVFENKRIVDLSQGLSATPMDEQGNRIVALFDVLSRAKSQGEITRAQSSNRDQEGKPMPFEGVVAITADKRVEYSLLKRVLYTAGAAGYKVFRLTAQKEE